MNTVVFKNETNCLILFHMAIGKMSPSLSKTIVISPYPICYVYNTYKFKKKKKKNNGWHSGVLVSKANTVAIAHSLQLKYQTLDHGFNAKRMK